MTPVLSPNTRAILLLTAPLITGRDPSSSELLTPGEYKRLARHLRELQRQPADLVAPDSADLLNACRPVLNEDRLARLLARGFLLSQAIERWYARAIWVISRADAEYPRRLKTRLGEDAPAVLYGCGEIGLLETGGLAVVGSRHVDDSLIEYAMAVGQLAAQASRTLVSGGAKGIDQAAMRGALEAGGRVSGVLADSLEKTIMNREHRNLLLNGQLVLLSPYDPCAGFNVGNAMQRNKLIYALADVSLVVSSDLEKGGTWTGAAEQLDKFKFVSVYVRSTGAPSAGITALRAKGAQPWPNPVDREALDAVFDFAQDSSKSLAPSGIPLFDQESTVKLTKQPPPDVVAESGTRSTAPRPFAEDDEPLTRAIETDASPKPAVLLEGAVVTSSEGQTTIPADELFDVVRPLMQKILRTPKKDREVAAALNVSPSQAKAWLRRLVEEGVLERCKKPAGYVIKQNQLFQ